MVDRDAVLGLAAELQRDNQPFVLATVVGSQGATSAKPGAKAIVRPDGTIEGWIGGGCTQPAVTRAAIEALADGATRVVRIRPGESEAEGSEAPAKGCPSGGTLEVFVEPILGRPALLILGASKAGQALAALARTVGFEVTVRQTTGDAEDFDAGQELEYVVVATQGAGDRRALKAALDGGARYIGFIASARKAASVKQALAAGGHGDARLAAIRAPAGLDIGARGPEEVALAILAEIVQLRRGGTVKG